MATMAITVGPIRGLSVVGHEWTKRRRLEMPDLGEVEQLKCKNCGRDFILVLSTGAIQAVAVCAISFWMLSPEVSERWIQNCPGDRLNSDEYDRMRRVREITFD
jgi:hypothetical protein